MSAGLCLVLSVPLMVYIEPSRQTLEIGNRASFHCHIDGHPIRSVEWLHNGNAVTSDSRVTVNNSDYSLVILRTLRSDAGMYQCIVGGESDCAQGSAQLSITGQRSFCYKIYV